MSRRKASKLFLEIFAARLNEVAAGRQPAMLAREIGITSATALKAYLDGKAIPLADNLHEMAKYFGKPMDWFFGADPPTEDELLSDHIMIPMYHVEAAAGLEGIVNGDSPGEPDDRYPFKLSWLATRGYRSTERLQQLMLIRVRGNSMDPTISDGEVVLVDLAKASRLPDAIKNGGVYLVRWGREEEGISIKRVHLDWAERLIVAESDNELYLPKRIQIGDKPLPWYVLGRVIWVGKENI